MLPSCILRSNIGHNIRETGELYTSVALRPVDGVIYTTPEQRKASPDAATAYARLPEVTFRRQSRHWFEAHSILLDYWPAIHDIHPTGRVKTVLVARQSTGCPYDVKDFVEDIPANARPSAPTELPDEIEIHAPLNMPHTDAGWGRTLTAAPFDYLIDPALTVGMWAGAGVFYTALAPFAGVYYLVGYVLLPEENLN